MEFAEAGDSEEETDEEEAVDVNESIEGVGEPREGRWGEVLGGRGNSSWTI